MDWPGNSSNPLKTSSSRSLRFLRITFHFRRKIAKTQGLVVLLLNILDLPLNYTNILPPVAGASVIPVNNQRERVICHKWLQCLLDAGWTCRPDEAERNLWLWSEPSHITIECLRRANIYSGNYTTLSRVTEKMWCMELHPRRQKIQADLCAHGWYEIRYRSGTVNSKSFVGKVLLRIKWKFELN